MPADDQTPCYCPDHAELVQRYGVDFGPFPGCVNCPRPPGFDPKTQYHLREEPAAEDA